LLLEPEGPASASRRPRPHGSRGRRSRAAPRDAGRRAEPTRRAADRSDDGPASGPRRRSASHRRERRARAAATVRSGLRERPPPRVPRGPRRPVSPARGPDGRTRRWAAAAPSLTQRSPSQAPAEEPAIPGPRGNRLGLGPRTHDAGGAGAATPVRGRAPRERPAREGARGEHVVPGMPGMDEVEGTRRGTRPRAGTRVAGRARRRRVARRSVRPRPRQSARARAASPPRRGCDSRRAAARGRRARPGGRAGAGPPSGRASARPAPVHFQSLTSCRILTRPGSAAAARSARPPGRSAASAPRASRT
jgi:hypothetical protein